MVRRILKNMKASRRQSQSAHATELLERLAQLEHEQWMHYSKDVSEQILRAESLDELQHLIKEKWTSNWIDYSLLPEEEKEKDRVWARKALQILDRNKDKLPISSVK
jgi:hypothetical protein